MCLPRSRDEALQMCVNIPQDPTTAGLVLRRIPRSHLHLKIYQVRAVMGMSDKSALALASRVGVRRRRCLRLLRSQLRITLQVDQ